MMFRPFRRATQVGVFCLMFVVPVLNLYEIYSITGTFYAINVGGLGISDPVVILQAIFASGDLTLPILSAAIFPILLALLFGRIWCGWMCPYHLLSDAAFFLRKGIRAKFAAGGKIESFVVPNAFKANVFRFGFLVVGTMAAGVAGIPILNYFNAPGTVSTEVMILVKERCVSIEIGFIIILVCLELVFFPRFWCRLFCPTGSLISLFRNRFTLGVGAGLKPPRTPCCKENYCSNICPMGLAPFKEGNNLLCTNCGRCIDACRTHRLRFVGFQRDDV